MVWKSSWRILHVFLTSRLSAQFPAITRLQRYSNHKSLRLKQSPNWAANFSKTRQNSNAAFPDHYLFFIIYLKVIVLNPQYGGNSKGVCMGERYGLIIFVFVNGRWKKLMNTDLSSFLKKSFKNLFVTWQTEVWKSKAFRLRNPKLSANTVQHTHP